MKKVSRLLIASLTFGFAGTAAAQDAPAEGSEPAPDAQPPADPNAPAMPDPAAAAAATAGRWPRQELLRPLTLPKGLFYVGVDIVNFTNSFFDPALIGISAGYGITDDFELSLIGYSFATSDAGKGSIGVGLGYNLVRNGSGGKLDAAARLSTGFDLAGKVDLTTGETSASVSPLGLGVQVRYKVTDKIAVFTPGDQLTIGLDPNFIDLSLPVGVGMEATPELFVSLETNIATINIKDSATAVIFADTTPLQIVGRYNVMPALDVLAGLSLDLTPPDPVGVGDTFAILVGARYYGGTL